MASRKAEGAGAARERPPTPGWATREGFLLDMLLELSFEVKELAKLIVGNRCSRKKEKLVRDSGT